VRDIDAIVYDLHSAKAKLQSAIVLMEPSDVWRQGTSGLMIQGIAGNMFAA
jgi:hypothetical protein